MMALDATTFYAGEFSNGKRHGRGFLITLEVEEKERLCKASAEAKLAWTMPSRRQTSVENEHSFRLYIYMNIIQEKANEPSAFSCSP